MCVTLSQIQTIRGVNGLDKTRKNQPNLMVSTGYMTTSDRDDSWTHT